MFAGYIDSEGTIYYDWELKEHPIMLDPPLTLMDYEDVRDYFLYKPFGEYIVEPLFDQLCQELII